MIQSKPIQQEQKRKLSPWKIDLFSGLFAGYITVSCCAPLDVMRTRLNMQHGTKSGAKYDGMLDAFKKIKLEEGFQGFYKGYRATVVTYPVFYSLFFGIYNSLKPKIKEKLGGKSEYIQYVAASCISGLICDVITNPLWLVRTRMQVQYLHDAESKKYTGIFKTLNTIYKEEGFFALYKGLGASLLGLSHVAIYFPIYENLKLKLQEVSQEEKISTQNVFIASVAAKLFSCCCTYPHIVIRTRLFDNRTNYQGSQRTTLLSIINTVYKETGVKGFYSGLKVDLIRVLPANTITFIIYEAVKQYLTQQFGQENN